MAVFESIFNILYLTVVIGLGIHLTLQKNTDAKLFGVMGIVLGLGDSFHLVPRIISYWSEGGFAANEFILSWGKAITSITMTFFYLLYYYFLKQQSGEKSLTKDILMYSLVVARIAITLMPQNEWGTLPGSYPYAIARNIPFAIIGILLVVWSYQYRKLKGIKYMPTLIAFSFLFYAPVVLWVDVVPAIGALMIPKTIAYFLIVYLGYIRLMPKFDLRRIVETSFVYLIFGLFAGIFYREFTKIYDFTGYSSLNIIHSHVIVLGVVGLLALFSIMYLLKEKNPKLINSMKRPFHIFNMGLVLMVTMFILKGMIDVLGSHYTSVNMAMIRGFSGVSHILLGVGMILSFRVIMKAEYR